MKNIPRIFVGDNIATGMNLVSDKSVAHYLTHVMRTHDFLAFGGGCEFNARISDDGKNIIIGDKTNHADPSNNITLYFAPIKHSDDLINMATQMGVKKIVPVITDHTTAHHVFVTIPSCTQLVFFFSHRLSVLCLRTLHLKCRTLNLCRFFLFCHFENLLSFFVPFPAIIG